MSSSAPLKTSGAPPTSLVLAGFLAWIWGITIAILALVLYTFASNLPAGQRQGSVVALVFLFAVVYCCLGFGLRRANRIAIIGTLAFTLLICLGAGLELLTERRPAVFVALLVNQVLFWLVIVGWTRMRAVTSREVGA
jgi:hypothetical protein